MTSKISSEAQALIDRLARMDPAKPRQDKAAIERAINAHLAALGLPGRPFIWADDVWTLHRIIIKRVAAGYRGDASSDGTLAVVGVARDYDRTLRAWHVGAAAAFAAVRDEPGSQVWFETEADALSAALDATRLRTWDAVRRAIRRESREAANAAQDASAPAANAAGDAVWRDNWLAFVWIAWSADKDANNHACDAITFVNGSAAFNRPTSAKLVRIAVPIIDAFEAGLFFYWITPYDVICLLQPELSIENGRLHRADGPAVAWPSGQAYHFWHGVQVPAWVIEEKQQITVDMIRNAPNQEIRRCMVEIYGFSRYLRDAYARLVHEDAFGRLWETWVGFEAWRIVEVENGTPELDGTHRTYTLNVTGAARILGWPIETARAAVAATYGLRPEEYYPEVRT